MKLARSLGWIFMRARLRPLPTSMYGSSPSAMKRRTVRSQHLIFSAASHTSKRRLSPFAVSRTGEAPHKRIDHPTRPGEAQRSQGTNKGQHMNSGDNDRSFCVHLVYPNYVEGLRAVVSLRWPSA